MPRRRGGGPTTPVAGRPRGAADDRGHLGEGVAEHVVQDEGDPFGRGHRFEDHEQGHVDRLVEGDPVGRVGGGAVVDRAPVQPFRTVGQGFRDPLADVALAPRPRRTEHVEADAAGDLRQPGAGRLDGLLLLPRHGVPAEVGLLHRVLGLGEGTEKPVGQVGQLPALVHDRAQAGIGGRPVRVCVRVCARITGSDRVVMVSAAPSFTSGSTLSDARPRRNARWRCVASHSGGASGGPEVTGRQIRVPRRSYGVSEPLRN